MQQGPDSISRDTGARPGDRLARGVCRQLFSHGFACLTEFVPVRGLRVDVIALGTRGEIWIAECKSSRADFLSDRKWQGYLAWCDRFFWAVPPEFPVDILPEASGVLCGDDFGAEILRMAPEDPLPAARRKALTRSFARTAALRLLSREDPRIVQAG